MAKEYSCADSTLDLSLTCPGSTWSVPKESTAPDDNANTCIASKPSCQMELRTQVRTLPIPPQGSVLNA